MDDVKKEVSRTSIDFDQPIDRRGSDSFKWLRYRGSDIVPMWVADMDFLSPPAVLEALQHRITHGVFGYGAVPDGLPALVVERMARLYDWHIRPEWLVWLPGLVSGLNIASRAIGASGDGVLCFTPVYPPFLSAPSLAGRLLQTLPLLFRGNCWEMDFSALQTALNEKSRLLLFCHPHNPVGRVWNKAELNELAGLCRRNSLIVCSDEIHCELILDERKKHMPFASLNDWTLANTITLMSASKSFNLAGLGCAFAIIADAKLRSAFARAMAGIVPYVTVTGYAATMAAFKNGDDWLSRLIAYLRRNRDLLERRILSMPHLSMAHVEATYLAWIDARPLQQSDPVLFFEENAGVGLSDGAEFGAPGFVRLNFGCPAAVLAGALDRMEKALERIDR